MKKKILTPINVLCLFIATLSLIIHLTTSKDVYHYTVFIGSIGALSSLFNKQWLLALFNCLLGISLFLLWFISDMISRLF